MPSGCSTYACYRLFLNVSFVAQAQAQDADPQRVGGQSLPPQLAESLPFASRPSADPDAVSAAADLLRNAQRCVWGLSFAEGAHVAVLVLGSLPIIVAKSSQFEPSSHQVRDRAAFVVISTQFSAAMLDHLPLHPCCIEGR